MSTHILIILYIHTPVYKCNFQKVDQKSFSSRYTQMRSVTVSAFNTFNN